MTTIELFDNNTYLYLTIASILVYFVSTTFASIGEKSSDAIWTLFWGITISFFAQWLGFSLHTYTNSQYFEIIIFFELCLILSSLICMCFAASNLLIGHGGNYYKPIFGFAGLIFLSLVYFVFITPNGEMVSSIRNYFPIAALAYITTALITKTSKSFGFTIATITTIILAISKINMLINQDLHELWYLHLGTNILLSISVIMIKASNIDYKLTASTKKIKNYNTQIEKIISSSPFPIIIARLMDDSIIIANDNAIKLFGINEKELERYKLKDFFLEQENRKTLNELLEKHKEVKDFEILVKTSKGKTPFWLLTSANTIDYNNDINIYLAFQDITSRKNREMLLKNQATRDPLTSLFNRRYFEEEVNYKISENIANNTSFSVLMIDVDKFKNVNDTYGHKVGDQVLISLANTCIDALRNNDIVARYGGEEFVVYLHNTEKETAKLVAERLRETIEKTAIAIDSDKKFVNITASIGIADNTLSVDLDCLVKMADNALYTAKKTGRNKSVLFKADDNESENCSQVFNSLHPVFEKEENQEFSLLDNIGVKNITTNENYIEEQNDIYNTYKKKEN